MNNFCVELGKVVEGVDETGIHIKELWKINQDYKDVVAQKLKNQAKNHPQSELLLGFEFQSAEEDFLKSVTQKIGKVVVQNVSADYFISGQKDMDFYYKPMNISGKYDKNPEKLDYKLDINNENFTKQYPGDEFENYKECSNKDYMIPLPNKNNAQEEFQQYSTYGMKAIDSPRENKYYDNYCGDQQYEKYIRDQQNDRQYINEGQDGKDNAEENKFNKYEPIAPYNRQSSSSKYQRYFKI